MKKLKTQAEVNEALRKLHVTKERLSKIGVDAALQEAHRKHLEKFGDEIVSLSQDEARLTAAIRAYAADHRDDIPGNKLDLLYGSLEFRASTSVDVPDEKAFVARAQEMHRDDLLRFFDPAPDKKALAKEDEETLAGLGAKIVTKENLTIKAGAYEVKEDKPKKDAKAA